MNNYIYGWYYIWCIFWLNCDWLFLWSVITFWCIFIITFMFEITFGVNSYSNCGWYLYGCYYIYTCALQIISLVSSLYLLYCHHLRPGASILFRLRMFVCSLSPITLKCNSLIVLRYTLKLRWCRCVLQK